MKIFTSTNQLCSLFFNDLFDLDVVYLVMTAELLCNSGFTHSWRSNKADPNWLQTYSKWKKGTSGFKLGNFQLDNL